MSDKTVVGELALDLQVDATTLTKQLASSSMTRQISGATNKMYSNNASAFSGLGKKLGTLLGVAALASFTKSCLELGSNLTEVQNVVDTTFVTMKDSLNSWAKDAMYQFGLSETTAKNYAATLGTMSQSMGTTEKQAYEMGTTIAGLAGDVASFYNMDSDEAYTKLKGIWTGETEALKSLGVVMTQTALDQYALNNGFGKTTAKMTEQEKLLLRYQYVTNALSKSSGDFIKTQDSWANQTRVLQLRYESIKATLGQGLINVLTPLLKLINNLAEKVQILAERFSSLTSSIFGNSSGSSSLDNITDSANGTADSIDNITDSAIKATKELAGFDKINKLGEDSSTGAGSTSTVLGESVSYGEQMTKNLTKSIGDIDISKVVMSFNEFISKTLKKINWSALGQSIGKFLHSIDWIGIFASLCDVVSSALTSGFKLWIGALKEAPVETALITTMALWKYTGVGKKIGGIIGGSIGSYAVSAIAAAIGGFSLGNAIYEMLTGNEVGMTMSEQGKYLLDVIINPQPGDFKAILKGFDEWLEILGGKISFFPIIRQISWIKSIIKSIIGGIEDTIDSVRDLMKDIGLIQEHGGSSHDSSSGRSHGGRGTSMNFMDELNKMFGINDAEDAEKSGNTLGRSFANGVSNGVLSSKTITTSSIRTITVGMSNTFIQKLNGSNDTIKNAAQNLVSNSIVKPFSDSNIKITSALDTVKKTVDNKLSTINSSIKLTLNTGSALSAINKFVSDANKSLSGISLGVGTAVKSIAGSVTKSNDFLKISALAQGGYVKANTPQLAMIGDNRHQGEVVAPEDKLTEMALSAVQQAGTGYNKEILATLKLILQILQALDLNIVIDGKKLKDIIVANINEQTKHTGICEIII